MAAGKQQRNASVKKRKPQWVEHMDWVYSQPFTTQSRVGVLMYLMRRAGVKAVCWPNEETISAATKIGLSTVKRAIRVLEACGLITITRRRIPGVRKGRAGSSNSYQLIYGKTADEAAVIKAELLVKIGRSESAGKTRLTAHGEPLVADDLQSTMAGLTAHSEPVSSTRKTPVDASLDGLKEKSKDQKPLSTEKKSSGATDGYSTLAGDFDIGEGNAPARERARPGIFRPAPIPPSPWTPPWGLPDEPGVAA